MKARPGTNREAAGYRHAVTFYTDRVALARSAAGYLGESVHASLPAIVIATRPHWTAIGNELSARGLDTQRLIARRDLLILDSDIFLERVMSGADPHPARFDAAVTDLFARVLAQGQAAPVHAYGDAVDVLWKRGNPEAAIRLELLWNRAAKHLRFSLLCAYALDNFSNESATRPDRQAVCDQHDHIVEIDP